jgi:hypothetical protein
MAPIHLLSALRLLTILAYQPILAIVQRFPSIDSKGEVFWANAQRLSDLFDHRQRRFGAAIFPLESGRSRYPDLLCELSRPQSPRNASQPQPLWEATRTRQTAFQAHIHNLRHSRTRTLLSSNVQALQNCSSALGKGSYVACGLAFNCDPDTGFIANVISDFFDCRVWRNTGAFYLPDTRIYQVFKGLNMWQSHRVGDPRWPSSVRSAPLKDALGRFGVRP